MFLLMLINAYGAIVPHYEVTTTYRLDLGGVPISFLDLFVALALIGALLKGPANQLLYPSSRTHPAMQAILACQFIAVIFGTTAGFLYGNPPKYIFSDLREYLAFPIFIIAGYNMLPNPKWAGRYAYFMLAMGVCGATMLLLNFGVNAEAAGLHSLNLIRESTYNEAYAGIAAAGFAYLLLARISVLPNWLKIALSGYCAAGSAAPLTRSVWLATVMSFAALLLLVRREQRVITAIRMVVLSVGLFVCAVVSIHVASSMMHKDFGTILESRLETLDPFAETGIEGHAWDTRTGAYLPELNMWFNNPLMGSGFGAQWKAYLATGGEVAYKHNGWSSQLATCGIFGLAGNTMAMISLMVVGYRLARDRVDRGSVLIGIYGLLAGVQLFIFVLCTLIYTARNEMLYGIICGMVFRCRDMQATTLEQFRGYIDIPGADEPASVSSNPLVPDDLIEVEPFVH
jgi:hypothetical protein